LYKLFKFDPNQRLTAEEAIKHPYLAGFYKESEIKYCEEYLDYDFTIEKKKDLTEDELRDAILSEIMLYYDIHHCEKYIKMRNKHKEEKL
jgi:hypothetical protein